MFPSTSVNVPVTRFFIVALSCSVLGGFRRLSIGPRPFSPFGSLIRFMSLRYRERQHSMTSTTCYSDGLTMHNLGSLW